MSKLLQADNKDLSGVPLEIRYVLVSQDLGWDENPKEHDIGAIIESIQNHGFRDPSAWDDMLEGLIEGNGRWTALKLMESQGYKQPEGIMVDDNKRWYFPVLVGINSETVEKAITYAIDHNNMVLLGGDFTASEMSRLWDTDKYKGVLSRLNNMGQPSVSMSIDDMESVLNMLNSRQEMQLTPSSELPPTVNTEIDDDTSEINNTEYRVITIVVENITIFYDILTQIKDFVASNSGWSANVYTEDDLK